MEISNRFCSSHPFCDLTSLIYWKYPIMRSYSPQSPILLDISNNNRRTDTKKRPCSFSLQRRFARGSTLLRMGRPYNPSPARQAHSARGRRPPGQAPGAVRVAPSLGRTSASSLSGRQSGGPPPSSPSLTRTKRRKLPRQVKACSLPQLPGAFPPGVSG